MSITYAPPEPEFEVAASSAVPHNREAEEAVLGSILIDPNCYYAVAVFIRAEHFYIHRHGFIWEAFETLENRRVPVDFVTLAEELDRKGKLGEVGGPAYLTSLLSQVPSSLNAESYARIVEGHAIRRKMIAAANKIASLAYDENKPIEQSLSEMKEETLALDVIDNGHNFVSMGKLLSDTYDDVLARSKNPKEVWGLATGLPSFDKKTGGAQTGELTYLVGGPGIGKTWLELSWGVEFAKQAPGAIISLEMKRGAIGRRILSGISGVSSKNMKSGYMEAQDWPKLTAQVEKYENHPLWIDDSSYDTHRLRATLTWAKREYGLKWFILDYALLMLDTGRDETEQSKKISAGLKQIVHDLNIHGTVLHSVVKVGMEGEEPKQSDQRGSGQAIHDADVQLFLTRVYEKDEKITGLTPVQKAKMATLWCSKGRDLEQSKFKTHLVRQGSSQFWGEYAIERHEPEPYYRKDVD